MLTAKDPRPKKCAHCQEKFTPRRGSIGQKVCSPACAIAVAPDNREKADKAIERQKVLDHRAAKKRIKRKGDHAREAQTAFNAWIRQRDIGLPCVSCGRHHNGQWHAGHYKTVAGSPELRFEPLNVHRQCAPCNNHKSGDIVNYRLELVRRIGEEKLAWLEGPHETKRYTVEDLQAITAHYRKLLRELKAAQG